MKTPQASDEKTVRNLVSEGCTWTVYEQQLPYAPSWRTLIFMSDRIARRVTQYPPNWFELSDSALAEVGTGA